MSFRHCREVGSNPCPTNWRYLLLSLTLYWRKVQCWKQLDKFRWYMPWTYWTLLQYGALASFRDEAQSGEQIASVVAESSLQMAQTVEERVSQVQPSSTNLSWCQLDFHCEWYHIVQTEILNLIFSNLRFNIHFSAETITEMRIWIDIQHDMRRQPTF